MSKGIVAIITETRPIEGKDRIHVATVLGHDVIVGKNWGVGYIGILFPADTQLSEAFLSANNLYREAGRNSDSEKKGFFENNGRVRCQPFGGVPSDGFFCGLDSLNYLGLELDLKVGDLVTSFGGELVASKYISPVTRKANSNAAKKQPKKAATPLFNQHMDTANFELFGNSIKKGALITIQAKVHGTSARYSHTKVVRHATGLFDKLKEKLGLFKSDSWEYVVGTRRVSLLDKDRQKEGFNGSEEFRFEVMDLLKPHLEKGMTVYGEIAGYANGKPIMGKHDTTILDNPEMTAKYGETTTYTYGCKEDEYRFHIYRISICGEDGTEVDFSDQQIKAWAEARGFLATLDVTRPFLYNGDFDSLAAQVKHLTERPDVLTEDYIDPTHICEGVVIRVDHQTSKPKFFKSKSRPFREMEGIYREYNVDVEDLGAEEETNDARPDK